MSDSINDTSDQADDLIIEACEEIHELEENSPRASFNGLVRNAPTANTSVVNGLSQQLIYQINLIVPNALVSFDDLDVELGSAAYPFVPPAAKLALQQAIERRGKKLIVNSAYRTLAQQMLLYNGRARNSNPVAAPGKSNHQSGLALDIEDRQGWLPFLNGTGWQPLANDPPHIDYRGAGARDLRRETILAFQQLWNKNNPTEKIGEDGQWGPKTESALNRSPAMGFEKAPWDDNPRTLRLSRPLMEGSDVRKLQEKLQAAGFAITVADGVFGPGTDKAVKDFQQQKGLVVDGLVGAKTLELIA
ncbi:putative peptidoglycan-binding domain-containing protein [Nostoc sp. NIES-3756]|uniref:peptidoglycan-binding protein n=1 Tax=Nostoc sp. NIES-3756 TaxID=1751286 RepID=UPI0007215A48|nr:peptidoglycan-binding protein [Nostoc sp. NIES-3756]BAT54405.1 putative peptidoglycan-binding domain-containing protein [Nostoc sp. NIES-3756]